MRLLRGIIALLMGIGVGALAGAGVGWFFPIGDTSTSIDNLHPDFRAEYTIMVAQSYALTGDWDTAQARLGRLAEPDPAGYVVQLTQRYIAQGRSPSEIRHLVRLAARYGYVTDDMRPYLPAEPAQP